MKDSRSERLARAVVLLCLGLGMASCGTKEPGPGEEVLPRLDVLHKGAWLMGVDAQQRFLLFNPQTASGTYAQVLPEGGDLRICDPAETAVLAQDGGSVLLWSAPSEARTRTAWLWRPGPFAGIPFTTRSQGDIVHDRSLSYVAFTEADAEAGTTSLRVMDAATCTAKDCPSRTLLQVPGSTLLLQGGGTSVLATDATQAWLIDVPSGAVVPLGTVAGPSTLSSDGTRYSLFDGAGHLQVFDTATRTLQWERSWAQDVSREGWKVESVLMTDAKVVVINAYEPPPPNRIPLVRATLACDASSCRVIAGGQGGCWWGLGRTDLVSCSLTLRCGPYGCEDQFLYFDASMRLLSNTTTRGANRPQPAFSEDLSQHVSLDQAGTLTWDGPAGLRTLDAPGVVDMRFITFLPGAERLVFAQTLTRSDEVRETRLAAWDGVSLTDLLPLPGAPVQGIHARAEPTALYSTLESADRSSVDIVRISL
ncbi:hypothetical protein JYK02_09425 [Corallococcus macrosporus]|uniref:Lipoprotein n=1 Tax=Corallococcus macrosporus TaxID=35 RepID=A0ABS3D7V9_9BACT|nr:hypothetical protein [Corallococcus macrosporus]MBN8227728.1 hypothetical protein [Corallococcus macrosporus]